VRPRAALAKVARKWRDFDPKFSTVCFADSETDANRAGPSDNDKLADESYWAVAELFITRSVTSTKIRSYDNSRLPPGNIETLGDDLG